MAQPTIGPRPIAPGAEHAVSVGGVLAAPPSRVPAAPRVRGGVGGGIEPERVGRAFVDGVIGGDPDRVARTGRAASVGEASPTMSGLVGGGLGPAGPRTAESDRRQYPADEEWEMPSGVEPVIKPGLEPDPRIAFDPGPNVIGLRP
jgi:hypothetical protein